jgi:ATP-dependent RNA helicase SUPV3L1/SUV3
MPFPRPTIASSITAQIGPTNTGKTHRAVERMLSHASGMIGLPLRLLAREIYDRVTAQVGEGAVALVTGEEKRMPARPRYFICTVEAMPAQREVDFLAIDEIHLAGHVERGHVFTDRLMHWRGRRETWLLGADTIRPILERLVPTAVIERRPRLSRLSWGGASTLRALPPRTAIVAFSVDRVYELAERLRARRGGTAVVMGALSPRARNAQVALYQSGEVDYMVATDAIGMGLNMDVDCVAFADLRKFDGRRLRELEDAELAQIAGRAGRHHNNGKFVTLSPLPALASPVVRAIEDHHFPAQTRVFWRNTDLDMTSIPSLAASLARRPPDACLQLTDDADDTRALARLGDNPEIAGRCRSADNVALLWQVCQIPDFRQLQLDDHYNLLRTIFLQLSGPRGRLEKDWIAGHIKRLAQPEGDIDTLLARMAFIRTWTYIAHHARWLDDASAWQEKTRAIEDQLSDALHHKLVQRFVDGVRQRGRSRVRPQGAFAEQLRQAMADEPQGQQGGGQALEAWVEELVEAPHERFALDGSGHIVSVADGRVLGRLTGGVDRLHPEVTMVGDELSAGMRMRVQRRLVAWTRDLVEDLLGPLRDPRLAQMGAGVRGLVYQLEQGLGTALAREAEAQLRHLDATDRSSLGRVGIKVGKHTVYVASLLRPKALAARVSLCRAYLGPGTRLDVPSAQVRFFAPAPYLSDDTCLAMGFPVVAGLAIRADEVEILVARIAAGARAREVARRLACEADQAAAVVRALGGFGARG